MEELRRIVREHVTHDSAAHRTDHTDQHGPDSAGLERGGLHRSRDGEQPEPGRIEQQDGPTQPPIDRAVCDEHDRCRDEGHDQVQHVAERRGRRGPQQDVADHASTERGHQRQCDDADEFEALADGHQAARHREDEHPDEIEGPFERRIQPGGGVDLCEESTDHRRGA